MLILEFGISNIPHDLLSLEGADVHERTVEVEHLEHVSPDSQGVLVLQLGFVVLPVGHVHCELPVVLKFGGKLRSGRFL